MNKEFKKDIDYIKYGLNELKDSYELHNRIWANNLLEKMSSSIEKITNYIENSIPKEKVEEKNKEISYRLNETMITERDMYYNLGKKEVLQELLERK